MVEVERELRLESLQKKYQEFQEFSKPNEIAIENKWRNILADETLEQQKDSLNQAHAEYMRILDQCDAKIERLNRWITDGEKQYQFQQRAQARNFELLSNLAKKSLFTEKNRFETSLKSIKDEGERVRKEAIEEYERHANEVREITGAIENEYEIKRKALEAAYNLEHDAITNKHQDDYTNLKSHLTDETNQIIMVSKNAYDSFKQKSEGKTQQFNQMLKKHKERQAEMQKKEKLIMKTAASIAHWRRKITNNKKESREQNDQVRNEKETLSGHFRELKETMARFRTIEGKKLAQVSIAYEDAIAQVQQKLGLAEKILKYAEMARKLETEREQVQPFPSSLAETDPEITRQMQQFKLQLKGDSKYVGESDEFDKFYRRYNKVLLERLSLQRERETLRAHNLRLRSMLKKYMSGMGLTQDFNDHPNTLFIVNQSTNAPMRKTDTKDIAIVDAPLTIAANQLQGQ